MSEQADPSQPTETSGAELAASEQPSSQPIEAQQTAASVATQEPPNAVAPPSEAATPGSSAPSTPPDTQSAHTAASSAAASDVAQLAQTVDAAAASSASSAGVAKSHKSSSGAPLSKTHLSKADESQKKSPSVGASSHRRKRAKLGELDLASAKIGFLGAGKIAESTINGLIHYGKISPKNIHVAAPSSKGLERFKALGCRVTKRNYDIFGRYDCDIIFLCFHGYVIKHCYKLGGARPHPLTTNYIPHQRHPIYILSLVSGVSLSQIRACLLNPESSNRYVLEIHRIMMNTAVGHGLGICAVDCEPDSKKLSAPLRQLLSSIAQLENVPASQMDAACALGGSGLAFSYYFIQALADGAVKMGLSRPQAVRFASKTAQCAAQTMLESGKHPAELRDTVSAPSGAAIYGIHVLEKNDVASGVTAAVEAAHKRANDLATQDVQ